MNRSLLCLWLLVIAASASLLSIAGSRSASARAEASRARSELVSVMHQATELARLRRTGGDISERSPGGLAAKVATAMSRAGLAGSTLQGLSPAAQSQVTGEAGAKLTRQRATATLAGLSLPQVGMFLDAWRNAEPDWIVSRIDLTPITPTGKEASATLGTDLPLLAIITIEGVFRDASFTKPGASR